MTQCFDFATSRASGPEPWGTLSSTSRFVLFVRVLDNCGYAPQNEWPDAFLQEAIPFLTAP